MELNWVALSVFIFFFALVTFIGFAAAHWRRGDLDLLHEWGLAGGRFGTLVTWFLLGGDLYTAYTFIAIPALAFGAGALGLLRGALYDPDLSLRLRGVPASLVGRQKHGYVTTADFVRGRFGNRWLALAIAVTGLIATMPYIALQLVGIQVVIAAMGFATTGFVSELPLIIAFFVLAAFTYSSGLRAPAAIAIIKDLMIYITVIAAIIIIPIELGGYASIFAAVPPAKLILAPPPANSLGSYSAYATLALGSAFALFLYPHAVTGVLSSSSRHVIRRNSALLPAYSFLLGLIALLGFMAIAARVNEIPAFVPYFKQYGANFAVPALFLAHVPVLVRRVRLRRDRDRRAGAGSDHVDRRGQYLDAQRLSRVHQSRLHDEAGKPDGEMGLAGRQVRRPRLHHLPAAAICHPAPAPRRHLHHPDLPGGDLRPLYALAQFLGAADRLGRRHDHRDVDGGERHFAAIFPLHLGG